VGLGALPLPLRRRALRGLLELVGVEVDAELLDAALGLLAAPGRLTLPGRRQLRSAGGRVRVVPAEERGPRASPAGLPLIAGQWVDHAASGWRLGLELSGPSAWWAAVPGGPLVVRAPVPGDVLRGGGRLQDLLVEARVPAEARGRVPVVACADGRVACAVGVGPAVPPPSGARRLAARPMDGRAAVRQAGYTFVLEGGGRSSAE